MNEFRLCCLTREESHSWLQWAAFTNNYFFKMLQALITLFFRFICNVRYVERALCGEEWSLRAIHLHNHVPNYRVRD